MSKKFILLDQLHVNVEIDKDNCTNQDRVQAILFVNDLKRAITVNLTEIIDENLKQKLRITITE